MKIKGYCPVCGHPDPEVGPDAFLRCTNQSCPSPDLVAEILLDNETEHVVYISENGDWVIRHPLRERVGDALVNCTIYNKPVWDIVAERQSDLPLPPGTWRLVRHENFTPELLDDPEYGGGPWGWEKVDA